MPHLSDLPEYTTISTTVCLLFSHSILASKLVDQGQNIETHILKNKVQVYIFTSKYRIEHIYMNKDAPGKFGIQLTSFELEETQHSRFTSAISHFVRVNSSCITHC